MSVQNQNPAVAPAEIDDLPETRLAWRHIAEATLAFVGMGIAGMIYWTHRSHQMLPCTGGGGCDIVAQSRWGHISLGSLTFDVALLGLLGYIALFSLAMLTMAAEIPAHQRRWHSLIWLLSAGGAAYSIYLQYVAHFRLGAFCPWCFSSAIVMTLLFLVATFEAFSSRMKLSAHD